MIARMRKLLGANAGMPMGETGAVVALGALLAGVALASAFGAISYSKVGIATDDVRRIGHGLIASYRDNGLSALDAAQTVKGEHPVTVLASLGGWYPMVAGDTTGCWGIPEEPRSYDEFSSFRISGHQLSRTHEALEGWTGRHSTELPEADPWGNKYLVNVRNLFHLRAAEHSSDYRPQLAVVVLSAGPNRMIETRDDQPTESFEVGGDDIAFRIQ